jgi:hypothetical protein
MRKAWCVAHSGVAHIVVKVMATRRGSSFSSRSTPTLLVGPRRCAQDSVHELVSKERQHDCSEYATIKATAAKPAASYLVDQPDHCQWLCSRRYAGSVLLLSPTASWSLYCGGCRYCEARDIAMRTAHSPAVPAVAHYELTMMEMAEKKYRLSLQVPGFLGFLVAEIASAAAPCVGVRCIPCHWCCQGTPLRAELMARSTLLVRHGQFRRMSDPQSCEACAARSAVHPPVLSSSEIRSSK